MYNDDDNNNNNNNNNNNTYVVPISILLFSSAFKKKYSDCIKYKCIRCMNLLKRVKTIMSTLKL